MTRKKFKDWPQERKDKQNCYKRIKRAEAKAAAAAEEQDKVKDDGPAASEAPSGLHVAEVKEVVTKESGSVEKNKTSSVITKHPVVVIDLASLEEGHVARRPTGSEAASSLPPDRSFTCDGGFHGQVFARLPALFADGVGETGRARAKRLGVQHALITRRLRDAGCVVVAGVEWGPRVFLVRLPRTTVAETSPLKSASRTSFAILCRC